MSKSIENEVVTVGDFLDFMFSKQPKTTKDTLSSQAIKAYEKGLLHVIPLSMNEKIKSKMPPIAFVEVGPSGKFLESMMRKASKQDLLDKEDFLQRWFQGEQFFSWCHLEPGEEERPSLPRFLVGASYEHTVYRVCELDNKGEASRFVEATATGIKNALGSAASKDPLSTAFFAQLSELQVVKGVRILILKRPEVAINRFGYSIWWYHANLVFAVIGGERGPNLNRERMQLILRGSIENIREYHNGLFLLDVYQRNSNRLAKPKQTDTHNPNRSGALSAQ